MRVRLTLAAVAVAALPVLAQAQHQGHGTMGGSDQAYMDAHQKMTGDMQVKPTGDSDRDFAAMMIPHHQGAIDMARIALKHGKDPEIRKLAEAVVSAQESEIAQLKEWLARHPK